ncbi:hypothetical protein BS50DRAFT_678073 [Corynespora cassiicola Philippines]|uniref:Mid2 domain-containing protein n=1 Tax=Corynespora cassiicola Philippines TaxID=1448308 RepID=A0A2T2NIR6_CORCC|nr:hypothetical protein BS50DRAFT_678073 [Corynespora cassiicola Philippines]
MSAPKALSSRIGFYTSTIDSSTFLHGVALRFSLINMKIHIVAACVLSVSVVVNAVVFSQVAPRTASPDPTVDIWSPALTAAPASDPSRISKRQIGDNTCGFISGVKEAPVTCTQGDLCVTNTFHGVHGCCKPPIESCTLPTTCMPNSLLSVSCTDAACQMDNLILKCNNTGAPECNEYHYIHSTRTIMTQHGCAESAFTLLVLRSYEEINEGTTITVYVENSKDVSSTVTVVSSNRNVAAIAGGSVGGVAVVAATIVGVLVMLRKHTSGKSTQNNKKSGQDAGTSINKHELHNQSVMELSGTHRSEIQLDSVPLHQLPDTSSQPVELDGTSQAQQLSS